MTAVIQAASKFVDDKLGKLEVSETSTRPNESSTETMKAVVYLVRALQRTLYIKAGFFVHLLTFEASCITRGAVWWRRTFAVCWAPHFCLRVTFWRFACRANRAWASRPSPSPCSPIPTT